MTPVQVYALTGAWLYDRHGRPLRRGPREDSSLSELAALTAAR